MCTVTNTMMTHQLMHKGQVLGTSTENHDKRLPLTELRGPKMDKILNDLMEFELGYTNATTLNDTDQN
jgi:hypothetical protein